MHLVDILFTALGVSMDAFAVAICKGLSMKKYNIKQGLIIALYFGFFQGLMPILGYLLGISFQDIIIKVDHWIAFILLSVIGGNMIKESLIKETIEYKEDTNFKTMISLSLATSIDALAVGITLAFLQVNIFLASALICLITFIMSFLGTRLGYSIGAKYSRKSEFIGGLILILIALKILLSHLTQLK